MSFYIFIIFYSQYHLVPSSSVLEITPFFVCIINFARFHRATAMGFSRISERITHLEETLLKNVGEGNLLHDGPGGGDQNFHPDDEFVDGDEPQHTDENTHHRSRSAQNNRFHGTAPARIENKEKMPTGRAKGGKAATTTTTAASRPGTAHNGRKAGITSASPPARRPQSAHAPAVPATTTSTTNTNANSTKPKVYGNVGAIAMAKAAARAAKKKQAHQPYATFEDSANNSTGSTPSGNFHFEPKAQLLFRGADGRVEASQLAAPPPPGDMGGNMDNSQQYQQSSQQSPYDQQVKIYNNL